MEKIKKGDKVRALRKARNMTIGKIYEVVGLDEDGDVYVVGDDGEKTLHYARNFELVKEQTLKEKYMVTGNVVEFRDGNKCLVFDNLLLYLNGKKFMNVSFYDKKMLAGRFKSLDIVKVFKIHTESSFNEIENNLKLIWQREEEKVTIELKPEQLKKIKESGLL
jgi:hypothetical protein